MPEPNCECGHQPDMHDDDLCNYVIDYDNHDDACDVDNCSCACEAQYCDCGGYTPIRPPGKVIIDKKNKLEYIP